MGTLDTVKRIIVEDFADEDKKTVEKLAYIINDFMGQVVDAFHKNITLDNLSQSLVDFEVTVDANGKPITGNSIKIDTLGEIRGMTVVYAQNKTNASLTPESAPFVSFTSQGSGMYSITKVLGLQVNNKYLLRLWVISK
jgi:hypothetical protein